jgi:hypothetical protein
MRARQLVLLVRVPRYTARHPLPFRSGTSDRPRLSYRVPQSYQIWRMRTELPFWPDSTRSVLAIDACVWTSEVASSRPALQVAIGIAMPGVAIATPLAATTGAAGVTHRIVGVRCDSTLRRSSPGATAPGTSEETAEVVHPSRPRCRRYASRSSLLGREGNLVAFFAARSGG